MEGWGCPVRREGKRASGSEAGRGHRGAPGSKGLGWGVGSEEPPGLAFWGNPVPGQVLLPPPGGLQLKQPRPQAGVQERLVERH